MLRKSILPLLLVLTITLAACAPAAPSPSQAPAGMQTPDAALVSLALTDGLGRSVIVKVPAQRIVSLAPSNTEILFAIGAGPQVTGRDQFSDYPEEAAQATDIGSTSDKLNTELILSLKPDLILAAGITPPEQIKSLEDLGLTVFMLQNPTDLDGMYDNLHQVAMLTGHDAEAGALIASLQARVKSVEGHISNAQDKPLVFYELDSTDADAPWTSGPGTFIDTLISKAGGRNIGSVLESDWAQISLEELVRQNPDIILLGDSTWGGVTPEMVKQRSGWEAIAAVKNDRVFPFDDNTVARPGPRLVDGLEALAKLLHPELLK
jgi:iron complex transport system substrate-binding protein